MRLLWITVVALALLTLIGWIGLRVQPQPFAEVEEVGLEPAMPDFVPLPEGLPGPVDRFYRTLYGDELPLFTSAVLDGRGTLIFAGIRMPARWRFVHEIGTGYRHYIETTWFGIPIMRVDEAYLDGRSSFRLPVIGEVADGPKLQQGANLGLWSEFVWLPSVWITDPRARWSPVDDTTALLTVPFVPSEGVAEEETFVVRFDPETGLVAWMESMRFRDTDAPEKLLWMNYVPEWAEIDGWTLPVVGEITWMDQGKPWAFFKIESAAPNADVGEYIRRRGL